MTARDAYVRKLKEQLDRWNAEISKLDVKAKQPLASVKDACEKQLKELRGRRNAMQQQLAEIQRAGDHARDHLARVRTRPGRRWRRASRKLGRSSSERLARTGKLPVTAQCCSAARRLAGHI